MANHDQAVQQARILLANELQCSTQEITTVAVEPAEWPDSALGCPKPGMMYMQVITPGYSIRLEHNGQEYAVHTDGGRRAVRCDK